MPVRKNRRLTKIASQKLNMRQRLWPDLDESKIWDRQKSDGWLSVPRSMPLIFRIMDLLAEKGKPISQTYFELWCRTYDDSFVILSKPREMAFFSGFSGERAERTWRDRLKKLADLGFMDFKPGLSGNIHYIILFNPYKVIKKHFENKEVGERHYYALMERGIEIGAKDLDENEAKKPVKKKRTKIKKA